MALFENFIRPVSPRKDLLVIADLIEKCFFDQMDEDGRSYIRQIRRAAKENDFTRWITGANERLSVPLDGYVWEENGQVIGNATIIPHYRQGRWRYLIANVAVLPEHRRRGIGRALTQKAIAHIHEHDADAWLQVRDDNESAHRLYLSLEFVERARRDTWEVAGDSIPELHTPILIDQRRKEDWPLQEAWLRSTYPPEVSWNLGFHLRRMRPGLWQGFLNLVNDTPVRHWVARRGGELVGSASWDPGPYRGEAIWLAASEKSEEESVFALLVHVRRHVAARRPLEINFPAGRAAIAFRESGFIRQNTLIWMALPKP